MLDPHTVLAILQLNNTPIEAPVVIKALWMEEKYDLFIRSLHRGVFSRTNTSTVFCGPDVDENNDISKGRHLKRFVKTKIGDNVQIGLRNLSLEVEREVAMNYGNEEQVLGNDEMTDSDGTDHEEAPCDGNVVM
jgi:hypothetical protein